MIPKEAYELQKICKSWANTNGFKYVWFSEGSILTKKTFVICNQQDLQNIPINQQAVNPPAPSTSPSNQPSQLTSKNPIIQPSILNLSGYK